MANRKTGASMLLKNQTPKCLFVRIACHRHQICSSKIQRNPQIRTRIDLWLKQRSNTSLPGYLLFAYLRRRTKAAAPIKLNTIAEVGSGTA